MTRRRISLSRRMGALLVGLFAVAASATAVAAAVPQQATARAYSISVVRTGGIHGGQSSFQLSGNVTKHSADVLRLAASPAFRALRPRYVPKDTCCDRYLYRVEVRYVNGQTKRVVALEGTPGVPKVFWDVVRRVESMPKPLPFTINFPPGFPFG